MGGKDPGGGQSHPGCGGEDPEDKRATLITLTEVGKARAYELEDERHERFAKIFEPLTEKEKEQLLKLLEKVLPVKEEVEK